MTAHENKRISKCYQRKLSSPNRRFAFMKAIVTAAQNCTYAWDAISKSVRSMIDHLSPPLPSLVKRGDRVLVKVNMGCTGFRKPEERYTSHPAYVAAIIECLQDCGASVMFGDDVSRTARYETIWQSTGMCEVAKRTGALLVDFISAGGREVRGYLQYPRTHLISNLVFDADVVVNAASCRSLSDVVMSGAIKNMFGAVLGVRRLQLHGMFPDIRDFSRVLVDIYRVMRPRISFLDLTTVIEGQSLEPAIQSVGLILGSTDPVAVDTVAQHAIGYEDLTVWTSVYGSAVELGCNKMDQIAVQGLDWGIFEKKRLRHPAPPRMCDDSLYDRTTRFLNHTIFRPRPVIDNVGCTLCGDCVSRCPVDAIGYADDGRLLIDHATCADCGCCLSVCDVDAVRLEFTGLAKLARMCSPLIHGRQSSLD
jgi:uncharacterized protein (DUF362 family)/ferredoxin